jgi:hypothetical protein
LSPLIRESAWSERDCVPVTNGFDARCGLDMRFLAASFRHILLFQLLFLDTLLSSISWHGSCFIEGILVQEKEPCHEAGRNNSDVDDA